MSKHVLFRWHVKFIIADHEGDCNGAENEELGCSQYICGKYELTDIEYKQIGLIGPNFSRFGNSLISAIEPTLNIIDDGELRYKRSLVCSPSIPNHLMHERKIVKSKIIAFLKSSDSNSTSDDGRQIYLHFMFADDILTGSLREYLVKMRHIFVAIILCLHKFSIPKDVIRLIYELLYYID
jgi:hypothetical protein